VSTNLRGSRGRRRGHGSRPQGHAGNPKVNAKREEITGKGTAAADGNRAPARRRTPGQLSNSNRGWDIAIAACYATQEGAVTGYQGHNRPAEDTTITR